MRGERRNLGLKSRAREAANRVLHPLGWDISRYPNRHHPGTIRQRLLDAQRVDLVIDVGASIGTYGHRLREYGYLRRIVSFEPVGVAYEQLARAARRDGNWTAVRTAVGSEEGETEINVAFYTDHSSILPRVSGTEKRSGSAYVAVEKVPIAPLDGLASHFHAGQHPFLKIDVQGFEQQVLAGARETLPRLSGIEIELAFADAYEGQSFWREDVDYLESVGFHLVNLSPAARDRESGELRHADGLFVRNEGTL